MSTTLNLDNLTLRRGGHQSPDEGLCFIEAVAWFAGEKHSDRPACVSPVIAEFGRTFNDDMRSDQERAKLVPLIPVLVGTATTAEDEVTRSWMAFDWLVRVNVPAWLRAAGVDDNADRLTDLPELQAGVDMRMVGATVDAARAAASTALNTVYAARTARKAVSATASATAWATTLATASAAARDASRPAARTTVSVPTASAARDAARTAATATGATSDKLQPTVDLLQNSAVKLIRRMANVGRDV